MSIKQINPQTVMQWINNQQAILIDVRANDEYAASHIKGSFLHPLDKLELKDLPAFNDKKLVIYCRSGKRSQAACEILLNTNARLPIYNLEGGIINWCQQGYPILSTPTSNGPTL